MRVGDDAAMKRDKTQPGARSSYTFARLNAKIIK